MFISLKVSPGVEVLPFNAISMRNMRFRLCFSSAPWSGAGSSGWDLGECVETPALGTTSVGAAVFSC